jgi:hypothetical protein
VSRTRTLIAWLVVIGLHLVPCNAYAQDAGPGREVKAIRHDLPILLQSRTKISIDAVAVAGDQALAQIDSDGAQKIVWLKRRLSRWWYVESIAFDSEGRASFCAGDFGVRAKSPSPELLQLAGLPGNLVTVAVSALPLLQHAPSPGPATFNIHCDYAAPTAELTQRQLWGQGPYSVTSDFAHNDAGANAYLLVFERIPTAAESWLTEGGNAYFYFSAKFKHSPVAVHVSNGTTLDVWFPFVLDTNKTYSLTIAHVTPVIGPINGTLKDNTLHFVLPAFAIEPDATMMGEIDGDPPDDP